ncbi:hypothetical protein [Aliidiomarina celeris]|uniref:hypothetical protein n=1 Tax=Aliidiomarina celeris TaxID=2249428 RepID=UPI000DEA02C0|nr:hypothetical protein [Aliidiomarina celeris]
MSDIESAEQRYAINFRGSVHDRAIAIRDAVLTQDAQQRAGFYRQIEELKAFYAEAARNATSGFTVLMVLVTLIAVAIGVVVSPRKRLHSSRSFPVVTLAFACAQNMIKALWPQLPGTR